MSIRRSFKVGDPYVSGPIRLSTPQEQLRAYREQPDVQPNRESHKLKPKSSKVISRTTLPERSRTLAQDLKPLTAIELDKAIANLEKMIDRARLPIYKNRYVDTEKIWNIIGKREALLHFSDTWEGLRELLTSDSRSGASTLNGVLDFQMSRLEQERRSRTSSRRKSRLGEATSARQAAKPQPSRERPTIDSRSTRKVNVVEGRGSGNNGRLTKTVLFEDEKLFVKWARNIYRSDAKSVVRLLAFHFGVSQKDAKTSPK